MLLKISNVSFAFYFNEFCLGGEVSLPRTGFEKYIKKAENVLSGMGVSFDQKYENEIKLCLCDVAERLYIMSKTENLKQESIDGYSATFADKSSMEKSLKSVVINRLGMCGLLYAGVEEND